MKDATINLINDQYVLDAINEELSCGGITIKLLSKNDYDKLLSSCRYVEYSDPEKNLTNGSRSIIGLSVNGIIKPQKETV